MHSNINNRKISSLVLSVVFATSSALAGNTNPYKPTNSFSSPPSYRSVSPASTPNSYRPVTPSRSENDYKPARRNDDTPSRRDSNQSEYKYNPVTPSRNGYDYTPKRDDNSSSRRDSNQSEYKYKPVTPSRNEYDYTPNKRQDSSSSRRDNNESENRYKPYRADEGRSNSGKTSSGDLDYRNKKSNTDMSSGNRDASSPRYEDKHGRYESFKDKNGYDVRKYDTGVTRYEGYDNKGRRENITTNPDGSTARTIQHRGGGGQTTTFRDTSGRITGTQVVNVRPDGSKAVTQMSHGANGESITRHANGALTTRYQDGNFVKQNPNGSRIEGNANHRNYYNSNNQLTYSDRYYKNSYGYRDRERTIYINNRTYVHNYYGYSYGGYYYNAYHPLFWYPTPFYTYMYTPWTPIVYTWGPVVYPWYYHPYTTYVSPTYWLTDYIILSSLAVNAAAQQRVQDNMRANSVAEATNNLDLKAGETGSCHTEKGGWLSSEKVICEKTAAQEAPAAKTGHAVEESTKDQIRYQVEEALKAHEAKKSLTLDAALKNPKYVFNVDEEMEVANEEDGKCHLSIGDMISPIEERQGMALMKVVASKGEGCDVGDKVLVKLDDLQDMQNAFMEKLEKGMQQMQNEKEKFKGVPADKPSIQATEK